MTTYKAVQIESANASELAELHGIRTDLQQVRWICDRLLSFEGQKSPADPVVLEALTCAAVIRYCRCFSGARPKVYPRLAAEFSPEQQRLHDYLTDYRSKFVAHSVNPFEDNRVTVSVPESPPDDWQPSGLGFFHGRPVTLGSDLVTALRELSAWIDGRVKIYMQPLEAAVLAEVKSIPPRQLAERDLITPSVPTPSQVKRRRK